MLFSVRYSVPSSGDIYASVKVKVTFRSTQVL